MAGGRESGPLGPGGHVSADGPPHPSAPHRSGPPARSTTALDHLVALEAHRVSVGFRPDAGRVAAGWEYRFVADGARADESVGLYRELGFEVAADPVGEAVSPDCADCQLVAALRFRAIYTRRPSRVTRPGGAREQEE